MLITLGIIGVVAALTIPTLISKYQEKVTVTKVKKMYSTLSNAYGLYKVENGPVEPIEFESPEGATESYKIFAPYLKISKDCGSNNAGCITGENYKNMDGTERHPYTNDYRYHSVVLNDGSSLIFRGGDDDYMMVIFYDVNGVTEPNQWGVDLFEFDVYEDSVKPTGYADYDTSCIEENANGWVCTAWLIYKENMDYLKK